MLSAVLNDCFLLLNSLCLYLLLSFVHSSSQAENSLLNYANKSQASLNKYAGNVNNRDRALVNTLLEELRQQLASRGARGIVGIQRKFRIMDDNGDHALSVSEFKKAMKECQLNLSDEVSIVRSFRLIESICA